MTRIAFINILGNGGADVSCNRLSEGLKKFGTDSEVVVLRDKIDSDWTHLIDRFITGTISEKLSQLDEYDVIIYNCNRVYDQKLMDLPYIPEEFDLIASSRARKIFYTAGLFPKDFKYKWSKFLFSISDAFLSSRETLHRRTMVNSGLDIELPTHIIPYPVDVSKIVLGTKPNTSKNRIVFAARAAADKKFKIYLRMMDYFVDNKVPIYAQGNMWALSSFTVADIQDFKKRICRPDDVISCQKYSPSDHDEIYKNARFSTEFSFMSIPEKGIQNVQLESVLNNVLPVIDRNWDVLNGDGQLIVDVPLSKRVNSDDIKLFSDQFMEVIDITDDEYIYRLDNVKRFLINNHSDEILIKNLKIFLGA